MSDSESSEGLSEDQELGLDQDIAEDADSNCSKWENSSSSDDNNEEVEGTADSARGNRAHRRGSGRTCRGASRARPVQNANDNWKPGYVHADAYRPSIKFSPHRSPGPQLNDRTRLAAAEQLNSETSFFKLFFTAAIVQQLCEFTNNYAEEHIINYQTYQNSAAGWNKVSVEEMYNFIALLVYMGFVQLQRQENYWSASTLYIGNWARSLIPSRIRFRALLAFFRCSDHTQMDAKNKLRQVDTLVEAIHSKCMELYQFDVDVAVDERMVKSKHRSGMHQYNKDKPTKWGIKLWVLTDSKNAYTYNFDVYQGKHRTDVSGNGLGYDVVMQLTEPLRNQGYHVYMDNFYTSPPLLSELKRLGLLGCGTTAANRRFYPKEMKTGHLGEKHTKRRPTWAKACCR